MKITAKQLQAAIDSLPDVRTACRLGKFEFRVVVLQMPIITRSFVPDQKIETDELIFKLSTDRHPPEWILNI